MGFCHLPNHPFPFCTGGPRPPFRLNFAPRHSPAGPASAQIFRWSGLQWSERALSRFLCPASTNRSPNWQTEMGDHFGHPLVVEVNNGLTFTSRLVRLTWNSNARVVSNSATHWQFGIRIPEARPGGLGGREREMCLLKKDLYVLRYPSEVADY